MSNKQMVMDLNNDGFTATQIMDEKLENDKELIFLNEEMLDNINDDLEKAYFGWYIDSNSKNSYFLSVFNSNNFSEELIFSIDFNDDGFVTEGFRFPEEREVTEINPKNKYFQQAKDVALYIKKKYL